MIQTIQAVYEHGTLRPLGPIDLSEQQVVTVTISSLPLTNLNSSEVKKPAEEQRRILLEFVKEMESMPDLPPQNGLTNRDHDQILYGPKS